VTGSTETIPMTTEFCLREHTRERLLPRGIERRAVVLDHGAENDCQWLDRTDGNLSWRGGFSVSGVTGSEEGTERKKHNGKGKICGQLPLIHGDLLAVD
jgi:hypothetical protein